MSDIELFKLMGSIVVDSDGAKKEIDSTEKSVEGLGSKLKGGMKTAGKWSAGLVAGAVAGGTAMFAATNKIVGSFDDIAKTAPKLGVSTDALQVMDYWAGQNGMSSGTMERAVGRLNQRIGMAADGNEKYSDALVKMGIDMDSVRDGTLSTEDAMAQSIKSLSEMGNEQEKAALASELFGTKLSRDLMPALQDGSLSLEEAKEKAEELGFVIGEETLESAEVFADTWDDLTRSLGAFGQKILAELIPVFQGMMDWVLDHMPEIQEVMTTVFNAIEVVIMIAVDVFQDYLLPALETVVNWVVENWDTIEEVIGTVIDTVIDIVNAFIELFQAIWEKWGDSITEIAETAWEAISKVVKVTTEVIKGIIDVFINVVQGDWEGAWEGIQKLFSTVWEAMSKLVSRLVKAIQTVIINTVNKIKSKWDSTWDSIKNKLDTVWDNMKSAVSSKASEIWQTVKNMATSMFDAIKNLPADALGVGKDFVQGLINGITNGVSSLVSAARNMAQSAVDAVTGVFKTKSPSVVMEGIGDNVAEGLAIGIEDGEGMVDKAVDKLASFTDRSFDISTTSTEGVRGQQMMGRQNTSSPTINIHIGSVRDDRDVRNISRELEKSMVQLNRTLGVT